MEAAAHSHDHHHELPTSGRALDAVALSATLHCLTGCAIGEIVGMVLGTALGFSNWGTVALSVVMALLFGYSLTSLPLLRAGLALAVVVPIALATDTFSIAVMELVDNAIMLMVPGAMAAGLGDLLFWGALSFALVVAGLVAFPVNRWLITRGKGHAVLHNSGHHPNFPTRIVAAAAIAAFLFGSVVLVAEAVTSNGDSMQGQSMNTSDSGEMGHGGSHRAVAATRETAAGDGAAPGLAVSANGLTLKLDRTAFPRGRRARLSFRITRSDRQTVRDFALEHSKRMHLIVVRRDTQGFQHLHPHMDSDGRWSTPITLRDAGSYRVFADFQHGGEKVTLGADLAVDGPVEWRPLPAASSTARTVSGYSVQLNAASSRAGQETNLEFTVSRNGAPIRTEPYLGAGGHLVTLREGDLGYLLVPFTAEFPTANRYRLFFQFKHRGRVHTAAFTHYVAR